MLPSTLIHCECSKIDDEVIDTVCHLCSLRSCLWQLPRDTHVRWPCRGPGNYLPVCHCGDWHLTPGQSMWDLWWTKWHWGRFLPRVLQFSPVSTGPPVLHTRSLLNHRRRIILSVDRVFEYRLVCISSFRFMYRGHIKGKFNRWCQVLWVLYFCPVSAAHKCW